tara:strand:- start:1362 stop:1961 length:600 start_codon:yes stop_codon:yes gene_type:complete
MSYEISKSNSSTSASASTVIDNTTTFKHDPIDKKSEDCSIEENYNKVYYNTQNENNYYVSPPPQEYHRRPPPRQLYNKSPSYESIYDPYYYSGPPAPIRTQGPQQPIQQLGTLASKTSSDILPLYGRRLQRNSWQYFTYANQYNSVMLPIEHKNKSCLDAYGCNELYDGDTVFISQYNQEFTIALYAITSLTYNPYGSI